MHGELLSGLQNTISQAGPDGRACGVRLLQITAGLTMRREMALSPDSDLAQTHALAHCSIPCVAWNRPLLPRRPRDDLYGSLLCRIDLCCGCRDGCSSQALRLAQQAQLSSGICDP